MKSLPKIVVPMMILSACATVENETYSTINLNGREYELRTRTVTTSGSSFVQHSVRARDGAFYSCMPDSPGSCEGALRSRSGGQNR